MAATVDPAQTSPKVKAIDKWGTVTTIAAGAIVVMLTMITPDMFPGLGAWAPVAAAGLVALGAGVSRYVAYQAIDPLRQNTAYQHELLTKGPDSV